MLAEPPDPVVPPLAEAPPLAEPPLPPLLEESGPVEQPAPAATNTAKIEDKMKENDEFVDRGRTSGSVRARGLVAEIRGGLRRHPQRCVGARRASARVYRVVMARVD